MTRTPINDRQGRCEEPAFPSVCLGDPGHPASAAGMTLRDWFAGHWLGGMLSGGAKFESPEVVAAEAYAVADAMLDARSQSGAAS